ncbi:hypothetical protein BAUCODRAFT_152849 [Baudoinia panamericana UAMH 10762]|uniref:Uncharacterized protein n=1 Tax=Baudoinia panamericana (strain UAMH 10762) TaxID=717646 RepID=M2MHX2_BAUPA|nr:uncharacterized protein BAUCODRAFT_152849 [Baudoinia panamericana UAMH 10762]EMC90858.1 hypothetical protein BAUCODRAFT_152849 [Baudoinia panamericana UAMH 10762]
MPTCDGDHMQEHLSITLEEAQGAKAEEAGIGDGDIRPARLQDITAAIAAASITSDTVEPAISHTSSDQTAVAATFSAVAVRTPSPDCKSGMTTSESMGCL